MYSWAYQYYRNELDEKQQKIYDYIYRAWYTYKDKVSLPAGLMGADQVSDVVPAIIKDHPEIFWVDYYRYTIRRSLINGEFLFRFYFDEAESRHLSEEAHAWKKRTVSKLPANFTKKDRAWLLFDYLARQVTYGKQEDSYSQTIIGPMSRHNHISVCEGIAKSYKFLCDEAGVPCIVVFGDANFGPGHVGAHAWNIIETEAGKKHVDVTAELQFAHRQGKATQTNFLHSDREMTQYQWDRRHTPVCG